MFTKFTFAAIPLSNILLDDSNPRIVTQHKLATQDEIVAYLFEHEKLADFIKKVVYEGKNPGAERPYVVKKGKTANYVVVEGNTRIAAYKLLSGLLKAPIEHASAVPSIAQSTIDGLATIECSIAPDRDALLPIMANSHFGLGDKTKWSYLGSRKAVYDEWRSGKSVAQLSKAFERTAGQISDLILEYLLYLEALKLKWSKDEQAALLKPSIEFNPPVRFLQTTGHKNKVGISYDKANLKVVFDGSEAKGRFKHLVRKLAIEKPNGLGATSTYDEVFADYVTPVTSAGADAPSAQDSSSGSTKESNAHNSTGGAPGTSSGGTGKSASAAPATSTKSSPSGMLFTYKTTVNSALLAQLMKEAQTLSTKKFPASATFLLRNIVEALLKHIIHEQKSNPAGKTLDLEAALNLCRSNSVNLPVDDKKILKEFAQSHLAYVNLGAHGNLVPNTERLNSARDCVDQFIKKYI